MADQPNVLYVFADQFRRHALGCAGNDQVHTPNFDRFARSGVRCTNACATYPVCTPSRGCLLSGQYPLTNRALGNDLPLPPSAPSVGEAFRDAGYRTGYVGKWHLDGVPRSKFTPPGPRRQGFDDFWAVYDCAHDYFNGAYYRDTDDLHQIEGYEPAGQVDLAREFLDEHGAEPFCLFLSWGPPHDPYELVPEKYRGLYDPEELALRPNAEPVDPDANRMRAPPFKHWGTAEAFYTGEPYDYDDRREVLADYYAQVTALDDQFGRLLDDLDSRGVREDTVIVFTADHGDMLWSQGDNQKSVPHAESVGVPFLVDGPGFPDGEVNDTLFGTVDVAPTLCSLAGVPVPGAMEGRDVAPALRDGAPGPESVYLCNVASGWRAVRTDQYTYARRTESDPDNRFMPGGRWLLYDNEADPYQLRNRVLDPGYEDARDDLDADLDAWLDRLGDPFLTYEGHLRDLGLVDEANEAVAWFKEVHRSYADDVDYIR